MKDTKYDKANLLINEKPEYLSSLNPEQLEAVENINGPQLVLAGAGTGKTKVLTTRLAHILNERLANPLQILTVTFTNKASKEMKFRAEKLSGLDASSWWLGTFHSIGARILRRNPEIVGLKSQFTIIDTDDQIRLIKQVLSAENIDEKRWPAKVLSNIIQRWKDRGLNPINADKHGSDFANNKGSHLYGIYQNRLKTLNAVDYGDLLLHNLNIFKKHPEILEKYQNQFRFILVDEYQDTNVSQYLWLHLLAKTHKNLCVVGDDDQSIYSWRGAEVGNILRFEKDFPDANVTRLEKNYRSTGAILEVADKLISNNKDRLGKSLWTDSDKGEPVDVINTYNGEEEALSVSDKIEEIYRRKELLSDIAILVRASYQTRSFEERFLKIGLPYKIIGGTRFYERLEIKDAICYLRIVNNENDDLAFERIINKPKRSIGDKSIQIIEKYSRIEECSLAQAAKMLADTDELSSKCKSSIRIFFSQLKLWKEKKELLSTSEITKVILDESGYTEMWQNDKAPDAPGRLENLKELVSAISDFTTLGGFLEHIQLVIDNDNNNSTESVNIMTLHAAKGLEFKYIFLPGWEEEIFPNKRSLDEGGLEEERRLAYVGITRAKKKVWIYHANNRFIFGQWSYCSPSRFINEISDAEVRYLNYNNDQIDYFKHEKSMVHIKSSNKKYNEVTSSPKSKAILLGEKVFHQKFGYGFIKSIDNDNLEVLFEKTGLKKVKLGFVERKV